VVHDHRKEAVVLTATADQTQVDSDVVKVAAEVHQNPRSKRCGCGSGDLTVWLIEVSLLEGGLVKSEHCPVCLPAAWSDAIEGLSFG
jgi:hypothetical protein